MFKSVESGGGIRNVTSTGSEPSALMPAANAPLVHPPLPERAGPRYFGSIRNATMPHSPRPDTIAE